MTALAPLDAQIIESWEDEELRAYFVDAWRSGVPSPLSMAIEAHQPEVLRAFCRLWWAAFRHGQVDGRLKERLRVEIAERAGCSFCATSHFQPGDAGAEVDDRESPQEGEGAALAFARRLAEAPWELGPSDLEALGRSWSPGQVAELVLFCAWQVGGPRAIRSWGADRYKVDGRLDRRLVPRLPYEEADAAAPPQPPVPGDPAALAATARREHQVPSEWLDLLVPRPELLAAWLGMLRATTAGASLPGHVGRLVRAEMARRLVCPAWAAAGDRVDPDPADEPVVRYVAALLADRPFDEVEALGLETRFGPPQRVELAFAVAALLGPMLVVRALATEAPERRISLA